MLMLGCIFFVGRLKSSASGRYNDDCFNEVRHRQDDNKAGLVHASQHMIWMFPKIVVPPNHPILIGFSIINHPFLGSPIFGNTHMFLFAFEAVHHDSS